MKIAVTGCNGFLGSAVCAHYEQQGHAIVRLSYRSATRATFLEGFEELLRDEAIDAVINTGASQNSRDDVNALEDLIDSNVFLPAAMASLIKTYAPNTCLLTFGTSWQIGENGEISPFNAYAASKTAAEAFLDHFALDGVRVASLRLYDTYGPGDRRNKVVNLIADALINRTELPMSAGGQVIDLVYIDDVVSAINATVAALHNSTSGVSFKYGIRSGRPTTILEVLDTMIRVSRISHADFIKLGVYPYRRRERFHLSDDMNPPPGWRPHVSLEEGVKAVLVDRILRSSSCSPVNK